MHGAVFFFLLQGRGTEGDEIFLNSVFPNLLKIIGDIYCPPMGQALDVIDSVNLRKPRVGGEQPFTINVPILQLRKLRPKSILSEILVGNPTQN